jgi:hypothetical protein
MAISSQATQECVEGSTTRARSPDRTVKPHERATVRVCSKCRVGTPVSATNPWCKSCKSSHERKRYASDPNLRARIAAHNKQYYAAKRSHILVQKSQYGKRVAEREKLRRRGRYATEDAFRSRSKLRRDRYYAANKHVFRARDARRRADQLQATPPLADAEKIRAFYAEAKRLTAETGIKHEVDHMMPLKGRNSCGLHVHYNLQVIPMTANRRKFNRTEDIV